MRRTNWQREVGERRRMVEMGPGRRNRNQGRVEGQSRKTNDGNWSKYGREVERGTRSVEDEAEEERVNREREAQRLTRRLLCQNRQMWQPPLSRKHMCTNEARGLRGEIQLMHMQTCAMEGKWFSFGEAPTPHSFSPTL